MLRPCLRSEDVLILLKLAACEPYYLNPETLAYELGHSTTEIVNSLERLQMNGMIDTVTCKIKLNEFKRFILYGVQNLFPARPGNIVRGMLTGGKSNAFFAVGLPYSSIWVWPSPEGKNFGFEITPLSSHCCFAAANDSRLRKLLAITETMRVIGTPARNWASEELKLLLTDQPTMQSHAF